MEDILNHLIMMDQDCQKRFNELKEKQDNIEYLVSEELMKRKEEIKSKYKFKIDMKKNEYEMKLSQKMQEMECQEQEKIEKLRVKYEAEKENIKGKLITFIMEEE